MRTSTYDEKTRLRARYSKPSIFHLSVDGPAYSSPHSLDPLQLTATKPNLKLTKPLMRPKDFLHAPAAAIYSQSSSSTRYSYSGTKRSLIDLITYRNGGTGCVKIVDGSLFMDRIGTRWGRLLLQYHASHLFSISTLESSPLPLTTLGQTFETCEAKYESFNCLHCQ